MDWHALLIGALSDRAKLRSLCQTARSEIESQEFLSRFKGPPSDGYTDIKMRQAGEDDE